MKKILFISLITLSVPVFSQHFTADNYKNYTGKTYHLYLLVGVVELKLQTDNTYTAQYESEGLYWYNAGKFRFEKGLIKLFPDVCKQFADTEEMIDCSNTLGEAKVDLIIDDYSLYYTQYLLVESRNNRELLMEGKDNDMFRVPVPGTEVPEGLTRMISKWQVITMGMKKAITTTATKIRKTPEADGEEVPYYAAIFEPEQKSVPKNTHLSIIARSAEKQKLNKSEDYWYYVLVGACDGVWMHGEYLKIE